MAAGFEYFTSADVGAPTLNAAAGRMIAVLDWVLVGKGGWAKGFTGTNLAVYRSGTGNRFYLRVDDTQARFSRLRAYRAMTAVSTGTSPFPNTTQAPTANWGVGKGYTEGAAARNYWGVRTNRYVLLFVENYSEVADSAPYNQVTMFAFGDVPSLCEADSHNTVLVGFDSQNADGYFPYPIVYDVGYVNAQSSPPGTGVSVAFSGTPNGAVVSPASVLVGPWNQYNGDATAQARIATGGRLYFGPLTFYSTTVAAGAAGIFPRARLPNLHFVYGGVAAVTHSQSPCIDREDFALGSRQFKVLCDYNGVTINRWAHGNLLEKTDTDGAL